MKTTNYNPSKLEVDFVSAFANLSGELEDKLDNAAIVNLKLIKDADNPMMIYSIKDEDGDMHEVVVQFIQRPDMLVPQEKKYKEEEFAARE
ncbi:MAG: hypothetical protein LPJ89_09085 [Hymenobacteraceae bacterium]|nr:hypothetical protein [Hymenobacteraceae bacterium]MDX5396495.1 hypothetical protein [Hymenobacteraceae bacterium]MDX5443918.1 hypothetical protein [Hymenobacteraceae bacterium]MDX5512554.1 hypothetical protein [Hymenobacteraceae bacterium]